MTTTYLVDEALLRQMLSAWDSDTGMKRLAESMDALRLVLAKEPSEPVGLFNLNPENGYWRQTDYGIKSGTPLYRKDA